MQEIIQSKRSIEIERKRIGVTPSIAAAFLAVTVYMWVETIFRLLGTYMSGSDNSLWGSTLAYYYPSAEWLTMSVVSVISFAVAYVMFRGKPRVGSLRMWTIVLTVSVILAPVIAEIGVPLVF